MSMAPAGMRVAVHLVDDSEEELLLAQEAVAMIEGMVIVQMSRNGRDALHWLRDAVDRPGAPDLVLLDLNMPIMNGLDTLKTIREDPRLCRVPVVIFSGSKRDEDILRAYRAGAATYLYKPDAFQGLCHSLERLTSYWSEVAVRPRLPIPLIPLAPAGSTES